VRSLHKLFQRLLRIIQSALDAIHIFKADAKVPFPLAKASGSSSRPGQLDWVIAAKLAVGSIPRAEDVLMLKNSGIRVIISLCAPQEGTLPPEIEQAFHCLQLILPDSHYSIDLTTERLGQAVHMLRLCDQRNLPMYVHCLAGVERSPTVCIAYLCRYYDLELWEAMTVLKKVRAVASPSPVQLQVIRQYLRLNPKISP
jgi:predicted protein tyrosine phosphatase